MTAKADERSFAAVRKSMHSGILPQSIRIRRVPGFFIITATIRTLFPSKTINL